VNSARIGLRLLRITSPVTESTTPARSKTGKVDDLFVDENDQPEYVGVKTGFLGTKSTLIPWQIVEVRDGEKRLVVAAELDGGASESEASAESH
jgi:hypothetical protein